MIHLLTIYLYNFHFLINISSASILLFRYRKITPENKHEYVQLALNYRLHEFDAQVAAVREGMSKVIPVPFLALFSGPELETMVCGSPDIPLTLLKSVATYKGININDTFTGTVKFSKFQSLLLLF